MAVPGPSPTRRRPGSTRPAKRSGSAAAPTAVVSAATAGDIPPPLPEVPVGKFQENISKARFELALPEQLVTRWQDNDFGIDAMVELTYFSQRPPRFVASGK